MNWHTKLFRSGELLQALEKDVDRIPDEAMADLLTELAEATNADSEMEWFQDQGPKESALLVSLLGIAVVTTIDRRRREVAEMN